MTAPPPLPGSLEDLLHPGIWAWAHKTGDHQQPGGVIVAVHRTDQGTIIETVRAEGTHWRHNRIPIGDIDPALCSAPGARAELNRVEQRILTAFGSRIGEHRQRLLDQLRTVRQAKEWAT